MTAIAIASFTARRACPTPQRDLGPSLTKISAQQKAVSGVSMTNGPPVLEEDSLANEARFVDSARSTASRAAT